MASSSSNNNNNYSTNSTGDHNIDNIRRERESALHELLRKNEEQDISRTGPPPRPYAGLPKTIPGPWPRNHGGPIRITQLDDGTLTQYGKKLKREKSETMAAEHGDDEQKIGGRGADTKSDSSTEVSSEFPFLVE